MTMLFGTRYRFSGPRSDEGTKALMAALAEHGTPAGTIAHYLMADGRGGLVIHESESILDALDNISIPITCLEFETHPMLTLEDALPVLMKRYS